LARTLQSKGYEVLLLGDGPPALPSGVAPNRVPADLRVQRIPRAPPSPGRREIIAYWTHLVATLFRRRHEFDVLHIHAVNFLHAAAIHAAKLLGIPVLVRSSLEGDLPDPHQSRSDWIHYRCLHLADRFVVLSRRLEEEYLQGGVPEEKVIRIPNGVDTGKYAAVSPRRRRLLRRELKLPESGAILTYHGVFIQRKSIDWAIAVAEEYLVGLELTLLLIGSPGRDEHRSGYFRRLEEQVAKSKARDSIILLDFKEDVHLYLQASDMYLLPSVGEGLPNALLEAMAVGLIPVVSKTSGSEEVVRDGETGFLFEPRDVSSFTSALTRAVEAVRTSRRREISQAACRLIERRFSIEAVAEQYARAYRRIR